MIIDAQDAKHAYHAQNEIKPLSKMIGRPVILNNDEVPILGYIALKEDLLPVQAGLWSAYFDIGLKVELNQNKIIGIEQSISEKGKESLI